LNKSRGRKSRKRKSSFRNGSRTPPKDEEAISVRIRGDDDFTQDEYFIRDEEE